MEYTSNFCCFVLFLFFRFSKSTDKHVFQVMTPWIVNKTEALGLERNAMFTVCLLNISSLSLLICHITETHTETKHS